MKKLSVAGCQLSVIIVAMMFAVSAFTADTIRSRADILALFADNTTGSITPQDLRDGVVSEAVFGIMYNDDNTGTTQALTAATPAVVNWLATGLSSGVTLDATTNERITVATAGRYLVAVQISMSSSGSAVFEYHARVNGVTTWPGFHRKVPVNDVGSGMLFGVVDLAANDYLDIEVESDSTVTLTIQDGQFLAYRLY